MRHRCYIEPSTVVPAHAHIYQSLSQPHLVIAASIEPIKLLAFSLLCGMECLVYTGTRRPSRLRPRARSCCNIDDPAAVIDVGVLLLLCPLIILFPRVAYISGEV
jgi:hypothetical protein